MRPVHHRRTNSLRHPILILGAGYGSLFAIKCLMAGHPVTLCCTADEAHALEARGLRVRFPLARSSSHVVVDSRRLDASFVASVPEDVDPARADLVVLAMQEPHYSEPGVRELLARIGAASVPCLSIMNLAPPPFLARLPGIDVAALADCYRELPLWDALAPANVTHASPDPQAVRRPDGVLDVGLASNFWIAPFEDEGANRTLRAVARDVADARVSGPDGPARTPVRLAPSDSLYRPLAKWPMLMAGNYRCLTTHSVRSIGDAVVLDADAAREVYEWVVDLCRLLGASRRDLVPFESYSRAAATLGKPSSVARAIAGGAVRVERTDRLIQRLGEQRGRRLVALDAVVATLDARLGANRCSALR